MMANKLWPLKEDKGFEKKRRNAQAIISFLLPKIDEGTSFSLEMKDSIAISELICSTSTSISSEVLLVLKKMSIENRMSIDDFERIFEEINRKNKSSPKNNSVQWKFYLSSNIQIPPDFQGKASFHVLGKDFSFIRAEDMYLELEETDREYIHSNRNVFKSGDIEFISEDHPIYYLAVSGRGSDWERAWDDIEPAYDVLRGVSAFLQENIQVVFPYWQRDFGPIKQNLISLSRWMIVKPEGKQILVVGTDADKSKNHQLMGKDKFDQLTNIYKVLKDKPEKGSTLELLADCFRLYAQALDTRFEYQCFLALWQVAEAVTRSETVNGRTEVVVKRLAYLSKRLDLPGSGFEEILITLSGKRNVLVHRGLRRSVLKEEINILKFICDTAVNWLIDIHGSLQTLSSLDEFYRLKDVDNAQINALKEYLQFREQSGV